LSDLSKKAKEQLEEVFREIEESKMSDALEVLARACRYVDDSWIAVFAEGSGDKAHAKYTFRPGENPFAEFMSEILPVLDTTRMNSSGVLREIRKALKYYEVHINALEKASQVMLKYRAKQIIRFWKNSIFLKICELDYL
jgi:hypothetical protein